MAAYWYFNQFETDSVAGNLSAELNDLTALQNVLTGNSVSGAATLVSELRSDLESGDLADAAVLAIDLMQIFQPLCNQSYTIVSKFHLLRVGSDGSSSDTVIQQWSQSGSTVYSPTPSDPYHYAQVQSGSGGGFGQLITNADQGVVLSWEEGQSQYCSLGTDSGCSTTVAEVTKYHLTTAAEWRYYRVLYYGCYDQNGNATGQVGSVSTQSWAGNDYYQVGSIEQKDSPPMDVDGTSFSPVAGGNPSQNETASVLCPCLLQTTNSSGQPLTNMVRGNSERSLSDATPQGQTPPPPPTYVLLAGDPGLNHPPAGPNYNVGDAFNLASTTAYNSLSAQGNLALSWRVSSVQDFVNALTNSGNITGGVIYFGHGKALVDSNNTVVGSELAPGENLGANTNVSPDNYKLLEPAAKNISSKATVTLNSCYAGLGAANHNNSIAQLIANQLGVRVLAPVGGMYFSSNPNVKYGSGKDVPAQFQITDQPPVYMIQEFGKPLIPFCPAGTGGCQ